MDEQSPQVGGNGSGDDDRDFDPNITDEEMVALAERMEAEEKAQLEPSRKLLCRRDYDMASVPQGFLLPPTATTHQYFLRQKKTLQIFFEKLTCVFSAHELPNQSQMSQEEIVELAELVDD